QQALAAATGVHYLPIRSAALVHHHIAHAFHMARRGRRPVIIGMPYDLQKQEAAGLAPYEPSHASVPELSPILPHPSEMRMVARKLAAAECPLILGGRGMLLARAEQEVARLAEA